MGGLTMSFTNITLMTSDMALGVMHRVINMTCTSNIFLPPMTAKSYCVTAKSCCITICISIVQKHSACMYSKYKVYKFGNI